ncbi:MAG: hypothetical protein AAF692_10010, partial [Pseudomonadota bacterium]
MTYRVRLVIALTFSAIFVMYSLYGDHSLDNGNGAQTEMSPLEPRKVTTTRERPFVEPAPLDLIDGTHNATPIVQHVSRPNLAKQCR